MSKKGQDDHYGFFGHAEFISASLILKRVQDDREERMRMAGRGLDDREEGMRMAGRGLDDREERMRMAGRGLDEQEGD